MIERQSMSWLARIVDEAGQTVGTGFLINVRHVLTAAHVVADTSGGFRRGRRPGREFSVEFPLSGQLRHAEVVAGGWNPELDFAVLSLLGPPVECDEFPRLSPDWTAWRDRPVRMRGFPADDAGATELSVVVSGGEPQGEWLHLRLDNPRARSAAGFSGAPVFVQDDGAVTVIGLATAARIGTDPPWSPTGFRVLPLDRIAAHWPPLGQYVGASRHGAWREPSHRATDPLASAGLSERDAGTLVEALSQLPDLHDPRLRFLFIRDLAARMNTDVDFTGPDDTLGALWALVLWCAQHPDGFPTLVNAIRRDHPGDVEADAVAELIERLAPQPLLNPGERSALLALLSLVPAHDVEAASRELIKPIASLAPKRPTLTASDTVRTLEDLYAAPGAVLPLVRFVERLALEQEHRLRAELHAWVDEFTARTGTPRAKRSSPASGLTGGETVPDVAGRPPTKRAVVTKKFLVFEIKNDFMDDRRYQFRAWLQQPPDTGYQLIAPDGSLSLERIRSTALDLVSDTARSIGDPSGLQIEFLVPQSLLDEPVDQWTLPDTAGAGSDGLPLGALCPVVVRDLERPRDSALRSQWRVSWNRQLHESAAQAVAEGLSERELRHFMARHEVPILLWTRRPSIAGSSSQELARLYDTFGDAVAADLPRLVYSLRRSAVLMGRPYPNITLLWDDPNRIPGEPALLTAPAEPNTAKEGLDG